MEIPDDIITKVRHDFSEDDSLLVLLTLKDLAAKMRNDLTSES